VRQRTVFLTLVMVLILLVPTLLGCSEKSPYGPDQVHFPEDEGAHPESSMEWWYLNATVSDNGGHYYTAMLAYFNKDKTSMRPALKIISIADLDAKAFYYEVPTISELMAAKPDYAEGKLDLRWDDYDRWYRTDEDSYHYSLQAKGNTIGFSFDLVQGKEPLTVGGDGLIDWTEGSTYYYSLTRLQVDGQIEIKGKTIDVQGIGWMDHQWMDAIAEKGWQWFSIQLDDDTDIICWNIVNLDGTVESSDLTMMLADGSIYHTTDLQLGPTAFWASPDTKETYGTTWTLREPHHDVDLEITARFLEQEIILLKEVPLYTWHIWEGGTTVSGQIDGSPVSGIGYAELVPRILVAG
jgi:predicted secreted hydrolase